MSNGLDPDQDQHFNILLVLILIQTVCKGYQQMTVVVITLARKEFNEVVFIFLQG